MVTALVPVAEVPVRLFTLSSPPLTVVPPE